MLVVLRKAPQPLPERAKGRNVVSVLLDELLHELLETMRAPSPTIVECIFFSANCQLKMFPTIGQHLCNTNKGNSLGEIGHGFELDTAGSTINSFALAGEPSLHIPRADKCCWRVRGPQSLVLGTGKFTPVRFAQIAQIFD